MRTLFESRPKQPQEEADQKLDDALVRLTESIQANERVCEKVRRRQSSGRLKLVSVPPVE
jgi:hypothetical protein